MGTENQPQPNDGGNPGASAESGNHVDQALEGALDDSQANRTDDNKSVEQRLANAERDALNARAELENFRKRMHRESQQQLKFACMPLVRDLLEVVDNLKRAIEAADADTDAASAQALRDGVAMVIEQLTGTLNKHGCKQIDSVGKEFDPNFHEAIAQTPSDEFESGKVAQEVATGYVLHDRVARPSSVIVSTGPSGAGSSTSEPSTSKP